MKSRKAKKGISDVVVSVLMILLVIVAVTILGTVLFGYIKSNTGLINPQSKCLSVQLAVTGKNVSMTDPNNGLIIPSSIKTNIVVRYTSGTEKLSAVGVYTAGGLKLVDPLTNETTKDVSGKPLPGQVIIQPGESLAWEYPENLNGQQIYAVGTIGTLPCATQPSPNVAVKSG